jgi:hypothetical protein
MADRFYSLDRGETEFQITEGAATSGEDIEVRFDLSVTGLERDEVLRALEMIRNHIIKGNWPPA